MIFKSIIDNEVIIDKEIECIKETKKITFNLDDTTNTIAIFNNYLILYREGAVKQKIIFKLEELTKSNYRNDMGLNLNFIIYTNSLKYDEKSIFIDYDVYLDDEKVNNNKIWLIF